MEWFFYEDTSHCMWMFGTKDKTCGRVLLLKNCGQVTAHFNIGDIAVAEKFTIVHLAKRRIEEILKEIENGEV